MGDRVVEKQNTEQGQGEVQGDGAQRRERLRVNQEGPLWSRLLEEEEGSPGKEAAGPYDRCDGVDQ